MFISPPVFFRTVPEEPLDVTLDGVSFRVYVGAEFTTYIGISGSSPTVCGFVFIHSFVGVLSKI